jgi:hypothetical protein
VVSVSFGSTSTSNVTSTPPNSSSNGAGEASASIIVGYGSVVYSTEEEASAAVLRFNG